MSLVKLITAGVYNQNASPIFASLNMFYEEIVSDSYGFIYWYDIVGSGWKTSH